MQINIRQMYRIRGEEMMMGCQQSLAESQARSLLYNYQRHKIKRPPEESGGLKYSHEKQNS